MIAQWGMDTDLPTPLLGGLSASTFVRRHWQKKPLVVRAAVPEGLSGLDRRALFALAGRDDVESRLVVCAADGRWSLRRGPLPRRSLPPLSAPRWSVLVQGVDLHDDAAHRLLGRFRFVADARLDDLMVSFASDGGGVGPHVDSYDVFLLQLAGRRRWRVGRVRRPELRKDVPLRMLAAFVPSEEWTLDPGDMLYLPPGWGHDGTAVGQCLTASIGFRAPDAAVLAADLLERIADAGREGASDPAEPRYFADAGHAVTAHPARVPVALQRFADRAIDRLLDRHHARTRALGEALSEPKPGTWFDTTEAVPPAAVALDRRTRMLYDDRHVFINGESFLAGGRDATLMRRLADHRTLDAASVARLSQEAQELLRQWGEDGWCRAPPSPRTTK